MSRTSAASASTGTTMAAMTMQYSRSACSPWRQLPEPAHTAKGMMATRTAMTAAVLRKVITWR